MAVLLAGGVSLGAWGEAPGAEARKPYMRCAAVFGLAATSTKEAKMKDAYTSVSMLLSLWASELDPQVPADQAVEIATRELAAEFEVLDGELRKARGSDAAAQRRFQQSFAEEVGRCRSFFGEVSKNRPKKD
jgi:hypothetical protein